MNADNAPSLEGVVPDAAFGELLEQRNHAEAENEELREEVQKLADAAIGDSWQLSELTARVEELYVERDEWRERAERAEADRDAALDLLRRCEAAVRWALEWLPDKERENPVTAQLYEHAQAARREAYAFLARVDSGTEPK